MSPDPQAPIPTKTAVKAPETPVHEPQLVEEPVKEPNGHQPVDRAAFLTLVNDLAEDTVDLTNSKGDTLPTLVRELTGAERADLITLQAEAYQKGSLKIREYEEKLLMSAVVDPESPKGARSPLLKPGDGPNLMKMGSANIRLLVSRIEELSNMGSAALTSAEGNSVTIPSVASTSG